MQADADVEAQERLRIGRMTHPIRGLLHGPAAVAALLALPTLLDAVTVDDGRRAVLLLYGLCLVGLFSVSTLYHSVPWSAPWKRRMRRADHVMIYVFIAAACTPYAFVLTSGWARWALIGAQWLIVAVGLIEKLLPREVGMGFSTTMQTIQGSAVLFIMIPLADRFGAAAWGRVAAAAVLYTIGLVMVVTRRPRLWPQVFSYHETFHVLVVVACALHFWVITTFVAPYGG